MFITVTRISDEKIVAQIAVSDSEDAHSFFCQQYDHMDYTYATHSGPVNPGLEFSAH